MTEPGASVLLLHGMFRSAYAMLPLSYHLAREGYQVHSVVYPTRIHDVAELARRYLGPAIAACPSTRPVHLVTHSLGGIIARQHLQTARLPSGSRIVMLAPPNNGSEVADRLCSWPVYRWLMADVGQQVRTGPDGIGWRLRPVVEACLARDPALRLRAADIAAQLERLWLRSSL